MIEILPLSLEDCPAVASAHVNFLNSPLKSESGARILEYHYKSICRQDGAVGYIAKINGQFAGYVCGIWNPKALRRILVTHWPKLVFNTLQHALKDPQFMLYGIRKLLGIHNIIFNGIKNLPKVKQPVGNIANLYELRPVVVLPKFRGQGIADELVKRLLEDAHARGFNHVYLLTEEDNFPAIKFYTRFGFTFEKRVHLHAGTSYETYGKLFKYYLPKKNPDTTA